MVGSGLHDHVHHIVGLRRETQRDQFIGVAGFEVATSKNPASADTSPCDSSHTTEIAGVKFFRVDPAGFLRQFLLESGIVAHFSDAQTPVQSRSIYTFRSNCICRTEVVPSVLEIFLGGIYVGS